MAQCPVKDQESSSFGRRGLFKRHFAWGVVLTLLVVSWWLPLLDSVLFHFGIWTSDEATSAVIAYLMFITMPLTALALLLNLYKGLRWLVKIWKARATSAVV
jgi:hypothetical protein